MISGTPTEMVILYSDLLKVEIDEDGEQLPHSTTPINSPAKSKKKMTEAMKRFSPKVVLDKSLADRVYNLSSKGIDVQFQHLQPIEETDLETVNPFSSESDIELRQTQALLVCVLFGPISSVVYVSCSKLGDHYVL